MGLDSYLSAKTYVNRENFGSLVSDTGLDKFTKDDPSISIYGANVSVTAAYWRKANHIHKWFVDNCQRGVDDCQEAYVSVDDLKELRSICLEIIADKSKAMDLLPPQSGFLFGSTEIDEWYMSDVEYTAKRLGELIKLAEESNKNQQYISFSYRSSW